ncbi:Uncharacterized protein APZ42_017164 [Daphnia magna]|uniref:C1q domain-containing protein n=1 Tax=Daphnia magna TaxID=35525 RepID=A0A164ZPU9_9CRUS|nr:Uncharacterized protein APZ42_017164 [Daphnia magna]
MWESVFWNEDNYRPDKTSKTLNEMYSKLDTENQKKMADSYQKSFKVGGKVEAKILEIFSAGGEFNKEFAEHGMMTKEDLDKFYHESKDHVVWDGEKFTPKPLVLSRINLSRLQDTQSLKDRKVSLRYTTAVLSTPINFVQNTGLTTTDEWQILKDKIKGKKYARNLLCMALTETVQRLEQNENHLAQMNTTVLHPIANLTALTTNMTSPSTIGRMPRTCADLRLIGHLKSGFYSVMGNKRLESVYCDFTHQEMAGLAQRSGEYAIPFRPPGARQTPVVNEGYVISNDGIFIARRPGKYFFAFSGQCDKRIIRISLQFKKKDSWSTIENVSCIENETFLLRSILQLDKDDQIRIYADVKKVNTKGGMKTKPGHFDSFVGLQLEEDIFP